MGSENFEVHVWNIWAMTALRSMCIACGQLVLWFACLEHVAVTAVSCKFSACR